MDYCDDTDSSAEEDGNEESVVDVIDAVADDVKNNEDVDPPVTTADKYDPCSVNEPTPRASQITQGREPSVSFNDTNLNDTCPCDIAESNIEEAPDDLDEEQNDLSESQDDVRVEEFDPVDPDVEKRVEDFSTLSQTGGSSEYLENTPKKKSVVRDSSSFLDQKPKSEVGRTQEQKSQQVSCPICSRSFCREAASRHVPICSKVNDKPATKDPVSPRSRNGRAPPVSLENILQRQDRTCRPIVCTIINPEITFTGATQRLQLPAKSDSGVKNCHTCGVSSRESQAVINRPIRPQSKQQNVTRDLQQGALKSVTIWRNSNKGILPRSSQHGRSTSGGRRSKSESCGSTCDLGIVKEDKIPSRKRPISSTPIDPPKLSEDLTANGQKSRLSNASKPDDLTVNCQKSRNDLAINNQNSRQSSASKSDELAASSQKNRQSSASKSDELAASSQKNRQSSASKSDELTTNNQKNRQSCIIKPDDLTVNCQKSRLDLAINNQKSRQSSASKSDELTAISQKCQQSSTYRSGEFTVNTQKSRLSSACKPDELTVNAQKSRLSSVSKQSRSTSSNLNNDLDFVPETLTLSDKESGNVTSKRFTESREKTTEGTVCPICGQNTGSMSEYHNPLCKRIETLEEAVLESSQVLVRVSPRISSARPQLSSDQKKLPKKDFMIRTPGKYCLAAFEKDSEKNSSGKNEFNRLACLQCPCCLINFAVYKEC